ncbi:hypothetical protein E0493_15130 [Roseomonas sp. M0104]|uniref:Uncharacterized protein n=1 Tax=Teichococcus coralli TaxID=2545983 RepID=A0A845BF49_9PROT|nr:hypothetical protein [Pseudoroseomonas coralli]MXP64684.1 hypothetical protein [Pseudoroseomonas coralli]
MRKLLIPVMGAAFLGLAGLAAAQPAPPPGPGNGGPPAAGNEAPPGPPMRGPGGHGHPDGGRGPGGGMMGPHHPPPPPGAAFMLRRGNDSIAIHCSERESMQACVNAASAMLDKMGSALR